MMSSTSSCRLGKSRWAWAGGAFAALILAMGNPGTAVAQQITGDIGFGGTFTPATNSFASASLASATSINYNGDTAQNTGLGIVTLATGSFSSFLTAFESAATLYDFIFNPLTDGGVSPLWDAGGFSFALDSVNINTQNAQTLSLVGSGNFSGNGFASTAGTWNFTGNPAGSSSFTFSAGTGSVSPVPEPEIYAMMGIGLGLMGWVARRRKLKESAVA